MRGRTVNVPGSAETISAVLLPRRGGYIGSHLAANSRRDLHPRAVARIVQRLKLTTARDAALHRDAVDQPARQR